MRWIAFCSTVCSREAIKFLFTVSIRTGSSMPKMLQVSGQNSLEEVLVRRLEELFRRGDHREKGIRTFPRTEVNVTYVSRYWH